MISWKENDDCCSWDGVTCDRVTGHVIGLDLSCSWFYGNIPFTSSLFSLPQLQKLNLAFNDFNHSQISPDFGQLISLTHLNLSASKFSGFIPSEIAHLSNLVSLDISDNYYLYSSDYYLYSEINNNPLRIERLVFERLVQNLTMLKDLALINVDMSTIVPNSLRNLSSSLTSLKLCYCRLKGNFPTHIFLLPNLQILKLGGNFNLIGNFPKVNWSSPLKSLHVIDISFSKQLPNSIGNLLSLRELHVVNCTLVGPVPPSLGNLTQLSSLSLRYNKFSGQIPSFLSNLVQLRFLDLSFNNFVGQFPEFFVNLTHLSSLYLSSNQLTGPIPSHVNALQKLVDIRLRRNNLNGTIPSWLFTLPLLEKLHFSDNQLTGHIDQFQSKSLKKIYLDGNRLIGSISSSIFEQVNLTILILSSNNFSGIIELHLFSKLKNLVMLSLSHNSLSINTAFKANSSFAQLSYLMLSGCNLSEFPNILKNFNQLRYLDLSENKISGQIPNWMWEIGRNTLVYLNLSHNYLTNIKKLPLKNLDILDLNSNKLQGSLPIPPPSLTVLFLSNNKLSGEIPDLICNKSVLEILDLSNNSFSGSIPICLGNFSYLRVLDLRKNKFSGTNPGSFAKGSPLRTLNLNENELEGPIPRSLVNCMMLEVLDIGNNKIIDTFPYWLQSLPELQVFILHSNKFYGSVWGCFEMKHCFPKLRVLDLSKNKFGGPLPAWYFKNLQAMKEVAEVERKLQYIGESYYQDSITVTIKGHRIGYMRILLAFTAIDFSNNNFCEEIPEVIGELHSLIHLNLSSNNLTGCIPSSLGNLNALESLDLSFNKLDGKISWQLANLDFLQVLDLSQNQLTGPIPRAPHFDTLPNTSYAGNMGLCGFPLSKECKSDGTLQPQSEIEDNAESTNGFGWKVVLIGYAFGMVIGLFMGYLVFSTGKPRLLVRIVEGEDRRKRRRPNVRR
ncbi:receptor-like protein 6 [Mangifera indica]|uniref:receptor-like protein 6 n=1 Tax=Mangifera indica TaxID=29780 RepID=UPI001CF993D5|nr:receptor-like protein 6 [Mangifera indica]